MSELNQRSDDWKLARVQGALYDEKPSGAVEYEEQHEPMSERPLVAPITEQSPPRRRVLRPAAVRFVGWLVWAICLLLALGVHRGWLDSALERVHGQPQARGAVAAASRPAYKNIEDVGIYDKVAGKNPEGATAGAGPDATWRIVRLRMVKDGGRSLTVTLARPRTWLTERGASPGARIHLDLAELGAVGEAEVLWLERAPPLASGPGAPVTGLVEHTAGPDTRILRLALSDGSVIPGVTANHPIWSEDRGAFVEAGSLRQGERLRGRDGPLAISAIASRRALPGEKLYNLEVWGEHCYAVADGGVVVHNAKGGAAVAPKSGVPDKSWKNLIEGRAHASGAHKMRIYREAVRMAKSGQYERIYLNRSLRTATNGGVDSLMKPDVTGVLKNGRVDMVEVLSPSQKLWMLEDKIKYMEGLLGDMAGAGKVVTPH